MKNVLEYLKERLGKAEEEVTVIKHRIEEEEARTKRYDVKVLIETAFGDFTRTITVSELYITIDERNRLLSNLAWLRRF